MGNRGGAEAIRPAVFFDRDDTVVHCMSRGLHHLRADDEMELIWPMVVALDYAGRRGHHLVCVTNQSWVAGHEEAGELYCIHHELVKQLATGGRGGAHVEPMGIQRWLPGGSVYQVFYCPAYVVHFFICPHRADQHCDCRKPLPGLIRLARKQLHIDMHRSFVVGNEWSTDGRMASQVGLPYVDATNVDAWLDIVLRVRQY